LLDVRIGNEPATAGEDGLWSEGPAKDCPECGVTASVRAEVCDVCFAELDEFILDPIDAPLGLTEPLR
jgi:hypothetical protein